MSSLCPTQTGAVGRAHGPRGVRAGAGSSAASEWGGLAPELMALVVAHIEPTAWMPIALTCRHWAACIVSELEFVARTWYAQRFTVSRLEHETLHVSAWVERWRSRIGFPDTLGAALTRALRTAKHVSAPHAAALLALARGAAEAAAATYASPHTPPFASALLRFDVHGHGETGTAALLFALGVARALPSTRARIELPDPSAALATLVSLGAIPSSATRRRAAGIAVRPSSIRLDNGSRVRLAGVGPSVAGVHSIAVNDGVRQLVLAFRFLARPLAPPSRLSSRARRSLARAHLLAPDGSPLPDLVALAHTAYHVETDDAGANATSLATIKRLSRSS